MNVIKLYFYELNMIMLLFVLIACWGMALYSNKITSADRERGKYNLRHEWIYSCMKLTRLKADEILVDFLKNISEEELVLHLPKSIPLV